MVHMMSYNKMPSWREELYSGYRYIQELQNYNPSETLFFIFKVPMMPFMPAFNLLCDIEQFYNHENLSFLKKTSLLIWKGHIITSLTGTIII